MAIAYDHMVRVRPQKFHSDVLSNSMLLFSAVEKSLIKIFTPLSSPLYTLPTPHPPTHTPFQNKVTKQPF